LRGRTDAVLFGVHAINAYVDEPRMTQYVDILSPRAAELAEELRAELARRFQIDIRNRMIVPGFRYLLEQVRQPKDRGLVVLRRMDGLPDHQVVEEVLLPSQRT
jgi:hypothetical protein